MKNNTEKTKFLNNLNVVKKNMYFNKTIGYIFKLTNSLIKNPKFLNFSFKSFRKNNGLIVIYAICFKFSAVNTFLHVTDGLGNLKFSYSAGLLNYKGKQKKNRMQVLNGFFKKLRELKTNILKNKPIALHLNNVGFYKYLIVRNLKKQFFIQFVKNYQSYSYNGCRKKKALRKR